MEKIKLRQLGSSPRTTNNWLSDLGKAFSFSGTPSIKQGGWKSRSPYVALKLYARMNKKPSDLKANWLLVIIFSTT